MAKGLRSSVKKANRARLRSQVFGPVEEARKERLSAKLLEMASKPSSAAKNDAMILDEAAADRMCTDPTEQLDQGTKDLPATRPVDDDAPMELDPSKQPDSITETTQLRSSKRRKARRGKAQATMVFHVPRKGRASAELAQQAPFDKVIFMVVDALRRLIRSGSAMPFTAHANAPTITMPRIKAMTTGSVPSFLDMILNFAESDKSSSLEGQDTWLAQLKAKRGGRVVMYGDDTWLKLFPETFAHADGTSSFFVSDFTEVDYNVTRNLPAQLDRDDWNGMVLHYLGLDHIGHKMGPNSPYMVPKQAEMDGVVTDIYQAVESKRHLQSTLLVLCGDHGMNDAGNHGGSAEGETSPALVFISPRLRPINQGSKCPTTASDGGLNFYEKVEQSDIAPTLAGLLGFPIPKNNIGVLISKFLPFWDQGMSSKMPTFRLLAVLTDVAIAQRMRLLRQNAEQVLGLIKGTFPGVSFDNRIEFDPCTDASSDGVRLACLWSRVEALNDEKTHVDAIAKEAAFYTVRIWTLKDIESLH
ncbi:MAG: hypothetical protein Q9181_001203 [Wetmoreana brouardii]